MRPGKKDRRNAVELSANLIIAAIQEQNTDDDKFFSEICRLYSPNIWMLNDQLYSPTSVVDNTSRKREKK